MSNRHLLHKNSLESFVSWAEAQGYETREGRGTYELVQIRFGNVWEGIYRRDNMPEHVTVQTRTERLVRQFLNGKQEATTGQLYEELRSIIDGGSESMTHEDAVKELKAAMAAYRGEASTDVPWD